MTTSSQKDIINDILSAMQCYPENEAFIIDDKHYTYAQLGEITASITHSLSEIKDEKIGIVAENRIETYAAILGSTSRAERPMLSCILPTRKSVISK